MPSSRAAVSSSAVEPQVPMSPAPTRTGFVPALAVLSGLAAPLADEVEPGEAVATEGCAAALGPDDGRGPVPPRSTRRVAPRSNMSTATKAIAPSATSRAANVRVRRSTGAGPGTSGGSYG